MTSAAARGLLVALAMLLASGCAGTARYLLERGRDLGDCVRGRAAFGLGLYAEAEVTSLLQPAIGLIDLTLAPRYSLEWDPRGRQSHGAVRTAAFPALLVGWPYYGYHETAAGYGDTNPYLRGALAPLILMGNHHIARTSNSLLHLHSLLPNPRLHDDDPDEDTTPASTSLSQHTWLAVSATGGLLNFDVGINPLEILDLVVGLIGIDVLGDDNRSGEEKDSGTGESVDSGRSDRQQ